jgi:hypothetical protein
MGRTGFSWLRIESSGMLLLTWWWTFRFHKKAGYFLTSWTLSFSNILHHGVSKWHTFVATYSLQKLLQDLITHKSHAICWLPSVIKLASGWCIL